MVVPGGGSTILWAAGGQHCLHAVSMAQVVLLQLPLAVDVGHRLTSSGGLSLTGSQAGLSLLQRAFHLLQLALHHLEQALRPLPQLMALGPLQLGGRDLALERRDPRLEPSWLAVSTVGRGPVQEQKSE